MIAINPEARINCNKEIIYICITENGRYDVTFAGMQDLKKRHTVQTIINCFKGSPRNEWLNINSIQ